MLNFRHKYFTMPLNQPAHKNTVKAGMINVHYSINGGATLTPEQENAIDYFANILAGADVALIKTGTVNSAVTASITTPPAVVGTAVGTII